MRGTEKLSLLLQLGLILIHLMTDFLNLVRVKQNVNFIAFTTSYFTICVCSNLRSPLSPFFLPICFDLFVNLYFTNFELLFYFV
jgi:hypothetical protein